MPQVSFRIRFNEPKVDKAGILETYKDYAFTTDMKAFLARYDKLVAKVGELPKIIEDYEKSIYQPDNFPRKTNIEPSKTAAYRLAYDAMSSRLCRNKRWVAC